MKKFLAIAAILALSLGANRAVAGETSKDIVDTAVSAGSFKTLAKALEVAGLIETLKGKGPFTVFAPTDAAFAKLPEGTVEALLKDKAKLTAVLTYHVVPGKVMAGQVVKLKSAKSVQGSAIKITVKDGKVFVNNANVIKTDIGATNGVIHVIDTVILPPSKASTSSAPQHAPSTVTSATTCSESGTTTVSSGPRRILRIRR